MSRIKAILGPGCAVVAFFLGLFAWVSFSSGPLWLKFIPVIFTLVLLAIGLFLILKRSSPLSKRPKMLITILSGILIVSPIMLDLWIRNESHSLQKRAKEFLSRPVPDMFKTDKINGYQHRSGTALHRRLHGDYRQGMGNGILALG